jgi:hypothetical protein
MAAGLLGEVRMDLQVDPKRQWLSRLWHVYTLFYADSVDVFKTDSGHIVFIPFTASPP